MCVCVFCLVFLSFIKEAVYQTTDAVVMLWKIRNICSCKQSIVPGVMRALPTRVVSSHTVSISPPNVSHANQPVFQIAGAG